VEVDHQIECVGAQRSDEARQTPPRLEPAHAEKRVAHLGPRIHQDLVDPGLTAQDAGRRRLHQPADPSPGVGCTEGRDGGQGPHHIADGPQPDHQDALGRRRRV